MNLIIATRKSPLALKQSELIKQLLLKIHPNLSISLLGITTEGDKRLDMTIRDTGGKALFVKELEEALLDGRADCAVHSMKDMPMDVPAGLILAAIGERADPRDVFISNNYTSMQNLSKNARIGTSSLRRETQLRNLFSPHKDLEFSPLRGNINTRLERLDSGAYDAIILAAAGLKRVHLEKRITSYLSIKESLPAAGQGALGIECRAKDSSIQELFIPLNHLVTSNCVRAERALCKYLGGGCKVPIAAYAEMHEQTLILRGLVSNQDGTQILRAEAAEIITEINTPEKIGICVAEKLAQQGAGDLLRAYL